MIIALALMAALTGPSAPPIHSSCNTSAISSTCTGTPGTADVHVCVNPWTGVYCDGTPVGPGHRHHRIVRRGR